MKFFLAFLLLLVQAGAQDYQLGANERLVINHINCRNGQLTLNLAFTSSDGKISLFFAPDSVCVGIPSQYVPSLSVRETPGFTGTLKGNLGDQEYCVVIISHNLLFPTVVSFTDFRYQCDYLYRSGNDALVIPIGSGVLVIFLLLAFICFYKRRKNRANQGWNQLGNEVPTVVAVQIPLVAPVALHDPGFQPVVSVVPVTLQVGVPTAPSVESGTQ